ncbi:MAG: exo-alpha-sialidase, partial [candidate division Zixibacteria bacterium]|nr:exo-alpha-sialidase [candidate division Zixibacteria bacterium]
MKKCLYYSVLISIIAFLAYPANAKVRKVSIEEVQKIETITLDETINYDGPPAIPYSGNDILDSPGIIVGTTNYDQQTNGSTGNRIAIHDCGKHICWMNGIDEWRNQFIYYNFVDPDGNLEWEGGVPVSDIEGGGYTQLDVGSEGIALVAYHNSSNLDVTLGIDTLCGFGSFTLHDVADSIPGYYHSYWPYLTNDANDRIHVVCTENTPDAGSPQVLGHTISTDDGETWSALAIVDTIIDLSAIITASRIDDKVAIVYTKPIDLEEPNQYNNDAVYIESEDGITWDYENIIHITHYQQEDPIRAYTEVDAVYDNNGNLHIVWNTPGYNAFEGTITYDACYLWHWSEATGISMIHDAWHPSFPGSWCRSACKISIAVDENNNLFTLWSHFDTLDISSSGYSNAELYISTSTDSGEDWAPFINLTDTFSD